MLETWCLRFEVGDGDKRSKAKGIKEARERLRLMSFTEEERFEYEEEQKNFRFRESAMETAKLEGEEIGLQKGEQIDLEKGKQEGKKEVLFQMVKNMNQNGLNILAICAITGLQESEVQEILQIVD